MTDEGIYADLPDDGMEDIYADLEDELNKAGYDPEHILDQPAAPALPFRNQAATKESPQQSKIPNKKVKKDKPPPSAQKKKMPPPAKKANPHQRTATGPVIPADMLNQRRLLKKVERVDPIRKRSETEEPQIDFRSNLRKVKEKPDAPKAPPPILKPKPSLSSIDIPGRIRYRRLPLSQVDLSNPPAINRDKKPRLSVDTQDTDDTAYDDDVYDDVTNIIADEDVYDDVENLSTEPNGQYADQNIYDDTITDFRSRDQPDTQDIYDDVENQNPDMAGELYDDVESVGIIRTAPSDVYDDVTNVGIVRKIDSPNDTYDDVCSPSAVQDAVASEDMYDELPDDLIGRKDTSSPGKKLSASQEKKRKAEEIKFRKKQMENEKKKQKELEKNMKEMEKKRKVFMEYYNIKESDKPLMVAQVASSNDLRGKQNLEADIGEVVHVLCKEHKKMPKGAWLAEKSDHSAIGFIAPGILNQNMLSTFDDY